MRITFGVGDAIGMAWLGAAAWGTDVGISDECGPCSFQNSVMRNTAQTQQAPLFGCSVWCVARMPSVPRRPLETHSICFSVVASACSPGTAPASDYYPASLGAYVGIRIANLALPDQCPPCPPGTYICRSGLAVVAVNE